MGGSIPTVRAVLAWFTTVQLVMFAWIFFRANSVGDAAVIIRHLADFSPRGLALDSIIGLNELVIALLGWMVLEAVQAVHERHGALLPLVNARPAWQRWAFYYALVVVVVLFGEFTQPQAF